MKLIKPTGKERQAELERQLQEEKNHLEDATQHALDAIKSNLSMMAWVKQYPVESAILTIAGGFLLAQALRTRRVLY